MTRLGLRARLTLFVTATFAAAVVAGAWVAIDRVEASLIADTRSSAEQVLGDYLDSINGGNAAVGVVDEQAGTQFFYRDADGTPIDEREYFGLIATAIDAEFAALVGAGEIPGAVAESSSGTVVFGDDGMPLSAAELDELRRQGEPPLEPAPIDVLDNGELATADGVAIQFLTAPMPSGSPIAVDLGDDLVAVSQTLVFGDGTTVEVGVSSPLQPVTESIDAFAQVVWVAVPLLVAAVAGVTWLATSRALRPVHGISGHARAITADRLAERLPVPDANDEVRELAVTVNGMLDRIEASQQRQRRLVSDASHELRSPVAASRAQLEVALAANEVGDWRRTALTVLAEQEQLSALVDDLLTLSRLDEGEFRPSPGVDLVALASAEASRPRPLRPVVRTRAGLDASVPGDGRLLERMLRNLVDNAVRHADGVVELSVGRTTDAVVVHVDDDGPGVAESHRHAVFERFTRLDEARDRDRGGSGLGLAIVREVASVHGGSVRCDAAPLGGARFTVVLPVHA
ncbi:MAG: ATP-binding protein [Actinomycetota bacterium]